MDGRILLVDDEKDILDLLEEVLRRDGFREIRRAQDGAGAIRACRDRDDMAAFTAVRVHMESSRDIVLREQRAKDE